MERLEKNRQVIFRYTTPDGAVTPRRIRTDRSTTSPGLCNEARNVVGLMPHPERACELAVGSADGLVDPRVGRSKARRRQATRRSPRTMTAIQTSVLERHGLTRDEYQRILEMLGREPTLTELGIFSVMWSEHCSYKSSRVHLKTLPTTGKRVLQGPGRERRRRGHRRRPGRGLQDRIAQPSVVHRAVPGRGHRRRRHHPRHLHDGRAADRAAELAALRLARRAARAPDVCRAWSPGIAGYGNSIGIPTVGGEIAFDESYTGNPLVNVFCLGIAKADEIIKGVASGAGNAVYYVGAKTGRDGIHGATMASAEFDDKSAEKRPAVQVGDPFMEKLLLEACLEVMKTDALVGIQDMGAAGLTCSTCEMGSRGGAGVEIDVALRAAARDRHDAVRDHALRIAGAHAARRQAGARGGGRADLREVGSARRPHRRGHDRRPDAREGSRRGRRRHSERGADRRGAASTSGRWPSRPTSRRRSSCRSASLGDAAAPRRGLPAAAGVAGHRQQALGVPAVRPHGPHQHAGAARAWAPASCASRARSARWRCRSTATARFVYLDPFAGAQLAVAEAARNVACAGGQPIGATNCLNFGNPERPEIMWQFARAVEGHGRGVPRARHPDHRRQRQPLQRDRRHARCCRRPCSASSA